MNAHSSIDILDFAKYIGLSAISQGMTISPLKLQKLLYYSQSWYMVFFGREYTIFQDVPEAWVNGPVYPTVYYKYKECVPGMCDHLNKEHFGISGDILEGIADLAGKMGLYKEEIDAINSVLNVYGSKTQNQLIFATHAELPWCEARGELLPFQKSSNKLSLDTMYSYYKERRERNRKEKNK